MKICDYVTFGFYDSKIKHANLKITEKRTTDCFEFDFLVSGNGTSFIDEQQCKLKPGLLILRKPGQLSNSILGFKCLYVYVNIDKNSEYYQRLMSCPNYYHSVDEKKYLRIFESLISLFSKYGTKKPNDLINSELLKLFFFLQEDSVFNRNHSSMQKVASTEIRTAVDFINANYSEKILLADIAKTTNYSPFYFQKKFTEIMKISPSEYLNNVRIENAKKMLVNSDNSLAEVAYACGFPSQSYLCYAFKKAVNVTPFQYRKSILDSYLL